MHDADDLPPEAFPWREMTRIQRHRWWWGPSRKKGFVEGDRSGGQEAFIDLYNRLAAEYGTAVTDGMIEGSIPPSDFLAMESRLRDDLDLWCEATGESRSLFLREAERLGLECWLWEGDPRTTDTHPMPARRRPDSIPSGRQRQEGRYKPKKSSRHDIPWRARDVRVWLNIALQGGEQGIWLPKTLFDAPRKWAPRRWFRHDILKALRKLFPGLPRHPLQISISRALNRERAAARAELATEGASEQFTQTESGEWKNTSTQPIAERNHPNPQGFWSVKRNALTDTLVWKDCRWEPCEDESPPQSVLDQRHEQPPKPVVKWIPLPPRVRLQYRRHCSLIPAEPVLHLPSHEGRPGAWSQRYVEAPAGELAAHRAECRRRREAAMDGLLSNFGCVDPAATSAALEAA